MPMPPRPNSRETMYRPNFIEGWVSSVSGTLQQYIAMKCANPPVFYAMWSEVGKTDGGFPGYGALVAKGVAWYMFGGAKPSTAAAGLGFDGSHNDSCHRRNSMSALRIWKADLSGCLATALVAVLFASSGIVYAQVLKKPAASAPPAKSSAQAAHTAAPAASHPAGGHTATPTNTGNRGPVSSGNTGRGPAPNNSAGRGPVPSGNTGRGPVPNNNTGRSFGANSTGRGPVPSGNAGRGPVPNNNTGRSFGTNSTGRGPVPSGNTG